MNHSSAAPDCPDCGQPMVLRATRTGKQFYLCPEYPRSKTALPIEGNPSIGMANKIIDRRVDKENSASKDTMRPMRRSNSGKPVDSGEHQWKQRARDHQLGRRVEIEVVTVRRVLSPEIQDVLLSGRDQIGLLYWYDYDAIVLQKLLPRTGEGVVSTSVHLLELTFDRLWGEHGFVTGVIQSLEP